MAQLLLGVLAATTASLLFNGGVALQALEARTVPVAHGLRLSLIGRLLRRPRWLLGTALGVLGWPFQALALALAPLTVVQPTLAVGLLLLLALGARALDEPIGARDGAAVCATIVGVGLLAVASPEASSTASAPGAVAGLLALLAAVAVAGWLPGVRAAGGGLVVAVSAGAAFAAGAVTTKLLVDALERGSAGAALGWAALTGLSAGVGLLGEMTALQRRSATQVAPIVLVVQVVIPVLAAPLVANEAWSASPLHGGVIAAGLALVAVAAVLLTRSPVVRGLVD